MVRLVTSGLLDMAFFTERPYKLESLNEALTDIVATGDSFTNFTIIHK